MMTIVNLFTPRFDRKDSYGRIASELYGRWSERGVQVNGFGMEDDPETDVARKIRLVMGGVILGYPTTIARMALPAHFGRRVIHTMFESTALPPEWIPILNSLDGVSVPSHFCQALFRSEGVTTPVQVHPLGIDTRTYRYVARQERERFTVVAIADRGERKGWHHAIHAFREAFGDDPTVELLLKVRDGAAFEYFQLPPNVRILAQDMSETELAAFYGRCDVMLFLSMGEGFGLPPREFAATGGLVLATDWSGMADDLREWGIPIPVARMVPAWRGQEHEGLGEWAEPDARAAAAWLRLLRDADVQFRNRMGMMARTAVRKRYSWDTFAAQLFRFWQGDAVQTSPAAVPALLERA